MTIITKGMGAVLKAVKKRKTLTISGSPKPKKREFIIKKKSKPKLPPRKGEVIIKKPSTTKLADTWQDRRIDAMNRKIKKSGRAGTTEHYIDEYSAVSSSKAPTKKIYKSVQKKWHSLDPDQKSKIYMNNAKRDPKSFHFDKKKFGKK